MEQEMIDKILTEGYFSSVETDIEQDLLDDINSEAFAASNLGKKYKYCLIMDVSWDELKRYYIGYGLSDPKIVPGIRKRFDIFSEIIAESRIFMEGKYEIGCVQYYDPNNRNCSFCLYNDIPNEIDLQPYYPHKDRIQSYNTNHSSEIKFYVYFNELRKVSFKTLMKEIVMIVQKANMRMKYKPSDSCTIRFKFTNHIEDDPYKEDLGMTKEFGWYSNWGMNNMKNQMIETYNQLYNDGKPDGQIDKSQVKEEIYQYYSKEYDKINPAAIESLINRYSQETYPDMARFQLANYIPPTTDGIYARINDYMELTTCAFAFVIHPGNDSMGKVPISVIEDSIIRVLIYTLPKLVLSVSNIAVVTKMASGSVIDDKEEERKKLRQQKNVARLDDKELLNTYGDEKSSIWFTTESENFWTAGSKGTNKKSWRLRVAECKTRHQERIAMWIGDKNGKVTQSIKPTEMYFSGDMRAILPYEKMIEDGTIWQ